MSTINKNNPVGIALLVVFGILLTTLAILVYRLIFSSFGLSILSTWMIYNFMLGSLVLYIIYQHQQSQKARSEERRRILERSYDAIHNGPLQILKGLIGQVSAQETLSSSVKLVTVLNQIDEELRSIYDFLQRDSLSTNAQIYFTKNYFIDLSDPLHELLYQVYQNKLLESSHYFENIKIKLSDFCPMDANFLTLAHKEGLIRFLEEALCNIEQHATGVTQLTITCKQENEHNVIQVIDDGRCSNLSSSLSYNGNGTKQAHKLARRLGGGFARRPAFPFGIVCELTWPVRPY